MIESYPVDSDLDAVTDGALMVITSHWRTYNNTPLEHRLGDENTWDTILPKVLVDVGIEQAKAEELCELAKLNAQL
jgi:hypothetical protein